MTDPADAATGAGRSRSGTAVVVVNYGSSDLLRANLLPLSTAVPGLRVVVVDNRTTEAERTAVRDLAASAGWDLLEQAGNDGFGVAVNAGAEHALARGADEIVMLNPDAVIDAASLALLRDAVRADPMALVAPVVARPDGSVWSAGHDLLLEDGRIRSRARRREGDRVQEWLSGACLMASRRLWTAVGGFAPEYFLYWEDVDLSARVLAAGGRLRLVDGAAAVHAEGGTQGAGHRRTGDPKSPVYYYYNVRNRSVFAALHLAEEDRRRWRGHDVRVAWEVLLQGGRRQLLTAPHRCVLPVLRGLRDGRRIARSPGATAR